MVEQWVRFLHTDVVLPPIDEYDQSTDPLPAHVNPLSFIDDTYRLYSFLYSFMRVLDAWEHLATL